MLTHQNLSRNTATYPS